MKNDSFFDKLWKFNALIIAAIGILGLCTVLVAITLMLYENTRRVSNEHNTIKTEATHVLKENFELGSPKPISGTHWVITPLDSYQYYDSEYSSKAKVSSTRNLLFSDMKTAASHWLFPSNETLILRHSSIKSYESIEDAEDPNNHTIGILYKVVKADSNKDGAINDIDKVTLALSTPDGKNYTELPALDSYQNYQYLKDTNQLSLMAYKNGKQHIVFVDLSDFNITKEIALPEIQK